MATKVMIPANTGVLKPRVVAPFEDEDLPDEDGLGTDPLDEGTVEEGEEVELVELEPIAVALKASNVLLAVGLTAKTIPALQWAPCPCLQ